MLSSNFLFKLTSFITTITTKIDAAAAVVVVAVPRAVANLKSAFHGNILNAF